MKLRFVAFLMEKLHDNIAKSPNSNFSNEISCMFSISHVNLGCSRRHQLYIFHLGFERSRDKARSDYAPLPVDLRRPVIIMFNPENG
jgi:hypothetical protein